MTHVLLPPAATLTAGAYLRKRREAGELSLNDVVLGVTGRPVATSAAATLLWRRLDAAERDVTALDDGDLHAIRRFFRFVPEIYRNLVAELPSGQLCRDCACSWTDPCEHNDGEPCAWAEPDLCTACAVSPADPAPKPSAPSPIEAAA